MELHPTGEVTEYTATMAYELLREGDEGRQKVDSIKFILRAEGNLQYSKVDLIQSSIWNGVKVFLRVSSIGLQQVQTPLKPGRS